MENATVFLIGWSKIDITPREPVLLYGQYYDRLSEYVQSNLSATACAMEQTSNDQSTDQSIMISIDLLWCTKEMLYAVRQKVARELPGFDAKKLMIFATHTHSAPEPSSSSTYGIFVVERLSQVAIEAWNRRKVSGGVGHTLSYVSVGHNRRVCYADGTTEMYGSVDREDFIGIEGAEDSSMDLLYCWGNEDELEGIVVNVPCPAQVTEAKRYVSADYWHEVRQALNKRYKKDVYVLAQCGVSGDLSPRDLTRNYKGDEPNMWEAEGAVEIGQRIDQAIGLAYDRAFANRKTAFEFRHEVVKLDIPLRTISEKQYQVALQIVTDIKSREPKDPNHPDSAWNRFLAELVENEKVKAFGPWDSKMSDYAILRKKELDVAQYHSHPIKKIYTADLHVLRIGDIAIATNPFELFVDFGFRIKGRSKAQQTFLVQLCNDYADYLPTERAINGEGYSAMGTMVGEDGGEVLVSKTVELIHQVFSK